MWTYHPELLATPVPRYTSYPTAAEFRDNIGAIDMGALLDGVAADERLSLYVHIPFCREICWYCGCNTGAANRSHRLNTYMDALEAEAALVATRLGGRGRIGRIAFGGGSPNAIPPERWVALVEQLRTRFDAGTADLSIEVDPRGFDQRWADALAQAGVSRASLGVQTFAPQVQAAIGRVQPADQIAGTMELLRQAGVSSVNFDLMYGLPGQTEADLLAALEGSVALGADRLAVFGYAHVPHLIPRQRRIDGTALAGPEGRFRHARLAHEWLTGQGYVAVGFDHFARPGDPLARAALDGTLRRNFQGFTDDRAEVLVGLGASAISAVSTLLAQNEKNNGRYQMRIAGGQLTAARGIRRSAMDRRRGAAIEALLCTGAADLAGLPEVKGLRARLARHEALGLVGWSGAVLRLTPQALPYARSIAATLDIYRQPQGVRFSSAV